MRLQDLIPWYGDVAMSLAEAKQALTNDSNDAEHDALYALVRALDPSWDYPEGFFDMEGR
jgi:hypothetical protein